jgi:pimeloyl-ACP methyl ester carboxylesterase
MSYESARRNSIRDALHWRVEDYATRYRNGAPTVVVLPGGLGSQLDRSKRRYSGNQSAPFERYDPVWMDIGVVFGDDARELEIADDGHDIGNHVIIPDGPLRFLVSAYDGTEQYFAERGFNYIVFGYDWRRSIVEAAGYLDFFLDRLRRRVMELRGEDPLPRTTLLCHSQGGLVATLFLQRLAARDESIHEWMSRVVTVGTPFYGTATHMDRYYRGQQPLNFLYGASEIARIAGTFPGPYILLYLDRATYEAEGEAIGLTRFPLRDDDDRERLVDPFASPQQSRFPPWVKRSYLNKARQLRRTLIQPLPDEYVDRFFNIRASLEKTKVELYWKSVDGSNYDPDNDESPIGFRSEAKGDGTVPYWSARLAQVPLEQVFDLGIARKHGELMEHAETLRVIERLINEDRLPRRVSVADERYGQRKASRNRVDAFIDGIARGDIGLQDPDATDPAIWRRLQEEISLC